MTTYKRNKYYSDDWRDFLVDLPTYGSTDSMKECWKCGFLLSNKTETYAHIEQFHPDDRKHRSEYSKVSPTKRVKHSPEVEVDKVIELPALMEDGAESPRLKEKEIFTTNEVVEELALMDSKLAEVDFILNCFFLNISFYTIIGLNESCCRFEV